jgi:hypothetical protein
MKQIYFETVRNGLVKVNCVRMSERDPYGYTARVMENKAGYYKGENITYHRRHFVFKENHKWGGVHLTVTEVQPADLKEVAA